ncbi:MULTISPECIES: LysR family transcriptional regulator [Methylobacterium]|uniref:LysR family transcriptional regulator n=1 Tax=Methylobacterium TaxID=407 RepID=UPI0013EDEEAE|nr:LysR family transcriptional regulator [Methylobacterium sp. DB0501]NGM34172.1 LysR family transcriptional regulator [Methylobacterium sp. DB0501]
MRHLRVLRYLDEVARTGSIRKAAERLNITASALNRRIQDLEAELGTPIFERLPRGVRLNAAGELLIRHARGQIAEMGRVRSQIEDLSGFRRGTVSIACSHALAHDFLPTEVAAYRRAFPLVEFDVRVMSHAQALRALDDYAVDLALIFRTTATTGLRILASAEQRLMALMRAGHPLAGTGSLRLRDCTAYPLALPDRSYGGRELLERAVAHGSVRLAPVVESNSFEFLRAYVRLDDAITFQIEIGAPASLCARDGLVARPVDARDVPPARVAMGQLPGRALSVAAAKFAEQLSARLESGSAALDAPSAPGDAAASRPPIPDPQP